MVAVTSEVAQGIHEAEKQKDKPNATPSASACNAPLAKEMNRVFNADRAHNRESDANDCNGCVALGNPRIPIDPGGWIDRKGCDPVLEDRRNDRRKPVSLHGSRCDHLFAPACTLAQSF